MIYKEIPIQVEGSDATSRAQFYILDTLPDEMKIQKRPIILICPGGGYHKVSYREGEPLAMHFLNLGYHACVLQYSVSPEAFYPTQLLEVTETVRQIHEHAKEWHVDTAKIVLAGASAGGHLAANYCAFWKREFLVEKSGMQRQMLKPKGLIRSSLQIPNMRICQAFRIFWEIQWRRKLRICLWIIRLQIPCHRVLSGTLQQIRQYHCQIHCFWQWLYGKQRFLWSCISIQKVNMDSALQMSWLNVWMEEVFRKNARAGFHLLIHGLTDL